MRNSGALAIVDLGRMVDSPGQRASRPVGCEISSLESGRGGGEGRGEGGGREERGEEEEAGMEREARVTGGRKGSLPLAPRLRRRRTWVVPVRDRRALALIDSARAHGFRDVKWDRERRRARWLSKPPGSDGTEQEARQRRYARRRVRRWADLRAREPPRSPVCCSSNRA